MGMVSGFWKSCSIFSRSMKSNAFANFCKLKNDELDYVEQRNVSHMLIYV